MTQPWEIQGFLEVRNNHLHMDGVNAVELAREYGTPLFVFSEARIRRNLERLRKSAAVIDCPLKLCYAAKAMSTMGILRAIKDAKCDIEVNSGGELWKALKAGFTGDQIIFNGTSKEIWEIELAIENSIYAIQVDSLYELSLIEETAKRLGKRANVSLRLVPEIETSTHSALQTALLTSKFGMMPDEAFEAFRKYKDSLHLDLRGLHLHIGSQNPEQHAYTDAFQMLFESMLRIYNESGIKLKHINLGGGFPINYLPVGSQRALFPAGQREMFAADFEPSDAIREAWNLVKNIALDSNAADLLDGLTLLLEPGRSIIADAGICLTTVRNHKERPIDNGQGAMANGQSKSASELSTIHSPLSVDKWLLTDVGFNNLLSTATYKWYYHLISAERADAPTEAGYKVAGPLCDSGDVYFDIERGGRLPDYRKLPADVRPGELLALLNTGAYTIAQMFPYNGRPLPAAVMVREGGHADIIRKRDSYEDLLAGDVW